MSFSLGFQSSSGIWDMRYLCLFMITVPDSLPCQRAWSTKLLRSYTSPADMTCLVMKLDCHFQDIKKHIFIFSKDLVHNEPLRTSEKFYELQNKQTINLLALYPSHDSGQPTAEMFTSCLQYRRSVSHPVFYFDCQKPIRPRTKGLLSVWFSVSVFYSVVSKLYIFYKH